MRPQGAGKTLGGLRLLLFLFACLLPAWTFAHPANVAVSQIKVAPDGTFVARLRFDIAAFATNATPTRADDDAMNGLLDGPDAALNTALADAEARFRAGFAAQSGGTIDRLAFPTVEDVRRYLAGDPQPRIPSMLTTIVEGHLPKGARTIAFRYPEIIDTVIQTVEFPYKEPFSEPVEAGRSSTVLAIPTPEEIARLAAAMNAPRKPVAKPAAPTAAKAVTKALAKAATKAPAPAKLPAKSDPSARKAALSPEVGVGAVPPTEAAAQKPKEAPKEGAAKPAAPKVSAEPSFKGGGVAQVVPQPTPASPSPKSEERAAPVAEASPAASPSPLGPVLTYLRMGYTHILPEGLDHILFVLGLFLLGSTAKALLKQITAFTVAHSITLALATLNVVRLPGRVIEPLIALSIAFVAIENLTTKEVRPWRTAVVFLFGLVHGMGFAEVFRDAGLSGGGLLSALLSFNVGVELGQLSVVALALLAVGWFRKDPRYRPRVVVPASLLIAAVALFWTAERIVG